MSEQPNQADGTENLDITCMNNGNSPIQSEESKLWGLLRRKGIDQEYKLIHRIKDGRKDVYSIGRQKQCDIVISDQRERLTMFVSDCSTNGTFVNNSLTRLSSGERTELKSGDEIFLMNPRYITTAEGLFVPKVVDVAPLNQHHLSSDPNSSESARTSLRRIEDTYVIGNGIGSGMCGQVHICTHKGTKKQYAVKIIDTKKFPKTPGLSASELRREAELMRNLNHPNIIQIKDSFETTHKLFIVMELVKGGDLFDRIIDKGRYSESEAREVMRMLLEAVRYLHSKGIVHRDLKPENILLVDNSPNSLIKLSDFGLAKQASREGLKTFCGTPQYFAPEVLGQRQSSEISVSKSHELDINRGYNFKADMWSIGVVLYIMLSGVFPFDEETLFDQLREARYSVNGPQWINISSGAKDLVQCLMRLNPEDRFDVEQALNHRWMKEISSLTPPDVIPALTETPSYTPVDTQDMSPPPVNHAIAKKNNFNPVFWSLRKNMSATLTGDFISEINSSHIETTQSQTQHRDQSTGLGVVDDIDEFSSDEDSKPIIQDMSGKKSRSRSKKSEKQSSRVALTFSKEESSIPSKNYSPSNMSRRRADLLIGQKQHEGNSRKRTEGNGIMEQLVKKKSRRGNNDGQLEPAHPISTLSDIISSPSRPPLSTPPKTPLPPTQLNSSSTIPSTTRSRRNGGLTIAHMFDITSKIVK